MHRFTRNTLICKIIVIKFLYGSAILKIMDTFSLTDATLSITITGLRCDEGDATMKRFDYACIIGTNLHRTARMKFTYNYKENHII